jgi:hypothetical protein
MGLTQTQKSMIEKACAAGGSDQAFSLTNEICVFLVGVIAQDFGILGDFPELPNHVPQFFDRCDWSSLQV